MSEHRLFTHIKHPHIPRNVNLAHKAERQGVNDRIAVWLTAHTGTMWTAYLFTGIGIGSLVGVFTNNTFLALLFGSISSYLLQLVLLPVIMTGQNVLSRHSELMAEESFQTTQRDDHNILQIMEHLSAQDEKILEILARLERVQVKK